MYGATLKKEYSIMELDQSTEMAQRLLKSLATVFKKGLG